MFVGDLVEYMVFDMDIELGLEEQVILASFLCKSPFVFPLYCI